MKLKLCVLLLDVAHTNKIGTFFSSRKEKWLFVINWQDVCISKTIVS